MDSLPAKPSSSRGDRDRDRDRARNKDKNHHRPRHKDRDGDKDRHRDRNYNHRHRRRRSPSPAPPSSKRPRTSDTRDKGKKPIRNGDINVKTPELGDDFVPFVVSGEEDDPQGKPRSERARQKGKERDWDVGKPPRGDEENRGRKRKYDSAFDEDVDRAYKRKQRFESYATRKTPWVSQVEWDSCHNVAEM